MMLKVGPSSCCVSIHALAVILLILCSWACVVTSWPGAFAQYQCCCPKNSMCRQECFLCRNTRFICNCEQCSCYDDTDRQRDRHHTGNDNRNNNDLLNTMFRTGLNRNGKRSEDW